MATHTAARRSHARRQATAPRHPRRMSGPIARPVPSVALPQPARRGSTGTFERLRALPEHRLVDRLLRGRAWIWLIGIMLGGIVAMQVSLLKLNSGISRAVTTAGTLERVNADLETEVARLSSGERIQTTAADEGMVAPPAGDVGYLTARPGTDPRLAVERMQSPSDDAKQVMANGGKAPRHARAGHRDPGRPRGRRDPGARHHGGPGRHGRARADGHAGPDRHARAAPARRDGHGHGRDDRADGLR